MSKEQDDIEAAQVITYLPNGKIRVWDITDAHIGTEDDPLTTIEIDGTYKDIEV